MHWNYSIANTLELLKSCTKPWICCGNGLVLIDITLNEVAIAVLLQQPLNIWSLSAKNKSLYDMVKYKCHLELNKNVEAWTNCKQSFKMQLWRFVCSECFWRKSMLWFNLTVLHRASACLTKDILIKFDQNLEYSGLKCAQPIKMKFCSCQDSYTVVTCAKFCCDLANMLWTKTLQNSIEFQIWLKYC